jgi:molecular chaperone HtpG
LTKQNVKVKVEPFKSAALPGMLMVDETIRRIKDMTRMSPTAGGDNPWADEHTLVVNQNNPAIKKLLELSRLPGKDNEVRLAVDHIYDLAYLQQGKFTAEMMKTFVDRSAKLLERL